MDGNKLALLKLLLLAEDYLSYETCAQQLQVSTRTILRFLKEIEVYCATYHVSIVLKKRKGIRLVGTKHDLEQLKLDTLQEKSTGYTSQERMILIMMELFANQTATKLYYLAYRLQVSMTTIQHDLSAIEEYLALNHLKIAHLRGIGIELCGTRRNCIWAIASFLIPYLEWQEDVVVYPALLSQEVSREMETFLPTAVIQKVKQWVDEFDYTLQDVFVLEDYHHFIVYLTILIYRRSYFEQREEEPEREVILQSQVHLRFHEFCKKIERLESNVSLDPSFGNLYVAGYLAMRKVGTQMDAYQYDEELYHLTLRFLQGVETQLQVQLNRDRDLIDRLTLHMNLVIHRLRMGTVISNPSLEEIKKKYEPVVLAVKQHLSLLENRYGIHINENEIGYITIHVLGAMMEQENSARNIKTAILCMSGMGTSKMLMETIRKHYPYLEIVQSLSFEEFNEYQLMRNGIQLIVSTIQLETITLPCVIVHPMMNEQDFLALNSTVDHLLMQHPMDEMLRKKERKEAGEKKEGRTKQEILTKLSLIHSILAQFQVQTIDCSSFAQLLEYFKQTMFSDVEGKEFHQKIMMREQLGSTMINELDFLLLHCRLHDITCLKCFHIKDGFPYVVDGKQVRIYHVLVMIAPQTQQKELLEMFSHISMRLATVETFQQKMCKGKEEELLEELLTILWEVV